MTAIIPLAAQREGRIYVAGPMTGLADWNFPAFNAAAERLRAEGWHVENPAEHGLVDGAEWADYLLYDLGRLATCEAVWLLAGWSRSKGATLEVDVAQRTGLRLLLGDGAEPVPANGLTDQQIMEAVRDLAADGGRWPSDWVAAVRRGVRLAALVSPQASPTATLPAGSPTAGMDLAQRILHVGGRNNAAGYVEFGSIQAVDALVRQVLRDFPPPTTPIAPEEIFRLQWEAVASWSAWAEVKEEDMLAFVRVIERRLRTAPAGLSDPRGPDHRSGWGAKALTVQGRGVRVKIERIDGSLLPDLSVDIQPLPDVDAPAAPAAPQDDARDAARYRKMRAWFVRNPRLADIAPYGHMQVTTESVVDAGVDALPPFSSSPIPSRCQQDLRAAGKPYPRTCQICGLGPCAAARARG